MQRTLVLGCVVAAIAGCSGSARVEPEFEVGYTVDGEFQPLVDGAACRVIDAPQGGYWVMPLLRERGFGDAPITACSLIDAEDDVELGASEGTRPFMPAGDEWWQHTFLLNLDRVATPVDYAGIEGHQALFSCSVANDAVSLTFEVDVVIESVDAR